MNKQIIASVVIAVGAFLAFQCYKYQYNNPVLLDKERVLLIEDLVVPERHPINLLVIGKVKPTSNLLYIKGRIKHNDVHMPKKANEQPILVTDTARVLESSLECFNPDVTKTTVSYR